MSKREFQDNVIASRHFMAQLTDLEQWLCRMILETAHASRAEALSGMADQAQALHRQVKRLHDALLAGGEPQRPG